MKWVLVLGLLLGPGIASIRSQNPLARALLNEANAPASEANSSTADNAVAALQARLAKARADLAAASAAGGWSITNRLSGASLEESLARRGLLQRLAQLYEQQISHLAELETVQNRKLEIAREAKSWTAFAEPRPYSILLVDRLRDAIHMARAEIASGETALSMLARLTDDQRALLQQAEERIRQLNEILERADEAQGAERLAQRELERLRSQVAAATIGVLDLERRLREERVAASRIHLTLLDRQILLANAGAQFTDADMATVLARIEGQQQQLERELSEAETRRRDATQALDSAQEALRRVRAETIPTQAAVSLAMELVETRRTQVGTADTALAALRFLLQASVIERTMWEVRFESYRSRSASIIRQNESRLAQFRRRVELWRSYYQQQMNGVSEQSALLETQMATTEAASPLLPLLRDRRSALNECEQMLLRVVREIDRGDRLLQRLAEGLHEAEAHLPLAGRVRVALSGARSFFAGLWNLELLVAQDTIVVDGQRISGKRSVTVGKILSAVLILVSGFWVTGVISRFMEPLLIKRFRIDANQATLIRRWFRVGLVFSLAILSLISVKIPFTVFAFAGGALAIGLGFGMQTVLKNFVSGIIILFERPFRVGDLLDIAGKTGTVVSVGIRSSILQRGDGTETLIPNSKLLEESVTNWTYSDRKVRFSVTVGVAYGSDTRRVVQLLGEVAERHGLVEKTPVPQVLFVNFGASSLDFELRFWVNVIAVNSAQVASDLRQMIAAAFFENGIIMAFPQQDIHLDATRPLPVQVIPDSPPAATGNATEPSASPNGAGESKAEQASPSAETSASKLP